jgi:hypothetical protein
MTRFMRAMVASVLAAIAGGSAAADAPAPNPDWQKEKCFRYERDWNEALRRYGKDGLSAGFVAGNAAFIRSGCLSPDKVCPRAGKDRQFADVLAIRVVNEGMSTTFLPFDCLR